MRDRMRGSSPEVIRAIREEVKLRTETIVDTSRGSNMYFWEERDSIDSNAGPLEIERSEKAAVNGTGLAARARAIARPRRPLEPTR